MQNYFSAHRYFAVKGLQGGCGSVQRHLPATCHYEMPDMKQVVPRADGHGIQVE
jgi:hypothetical protein